MQQAKDLMTQKQHIETFVIKQTDEARVNYHTLLNGALDCPRWLLRQGLAFRGHDESLKSSNRGNYIELMQFLADHNEKVRKVVFENGPKNLKYTSFDIQKDLVRACAIETINAITKDMEGEAIEKFLGVQHVSSTTSSSLEEVIERLFATTNLSVSKLRGQGYDGASNMRALVFVAKENEDVANFFINANRLVNLIGSSCKRRDALREKQQEQIQKALHLAVVEVVEWIKSDRNQDNLGEATGLFKDIQTFDFVFHLFLMRLILGITNELSQALQKKDQDIVNAMTLVEVCKQRLQSFRDDDFGDLLHDVEKFCEEHDIVIPNMEDLHFVPGKSRRPIPTIEALHSTLNNLSKSGNAKIGAVESFSFIKAKL
nr:zinc finger MYM-type protein 1-like [Malus domestica]